MCAPGMLPCLRTTIQLDDEVFRAFKTRAAQRGTTLAAEIEQALRADLTSRASAEPLPPLRLRTVRGRAVPGLDINSNAALEEFLRE